MRMLPMRLPDLPRSSSETASRRVHARADVELAARGTDTHDVAVDLFHDGLFLGAQHPEPVGTLMKLDLHLSGLDLRALGEVVWIRLRGSELERPSGMAVRLLYVEHRERRLLAEDLPPDWWTPHAWTAGDVPAERSAA